MGALTNILKKKTRLKLFFSIHGGGAKAFVGGGGVALIHNRLDSKICEWLNNNTDTRVDKAVAVVVKNHTNSVVICDGDIIRIVDLLFNKWCETPSYEIRLKFDNGWGGMTFLFGDEIIEGLTTRLNRDNADEASNDGDDYYDIKGDSEDDFKNTISGSLLNTYAHLVCVGGGKYTITQTKSIDTLPYKEVLEIYEDNHETHSKKEKDEDDKTFGGFYKVSIDLIGDKDNSGRVFYSSITGNPIIFINEVDDINDDKEVLLIQ